MSFSIGFIGRVSLVKKAIKEFTDRSTGGTRKELDELAPVFDALLNAQVSGNAEECSVDFNASGHASFNEDGSKRYGNITITVKPVYGLLV